MSERIETRYDKIDWLDIAADVQTRLTYLRAAWQASEQGCAPDLHRKMVEDLYLPTLRLLARFCECVEVTPDGAPMVNPYNENEMRQ